MVPDKGGGGEPEGKNRHYAAEAPSRVNRTASSFACPGAAVSKETTRAYHGTAGPVWDIRYCRTHYVTPSHGSPTPSTGHKYSQNTLYFSLSSASFLNMSSDLRTRRLLITVSILERWRISRPTLSGRSSESTFFFRRGRNKGTARRSHTPHTHTQHRDAMTESKSPKGARTNTKQRWPGTRQPGLVVCSTSDKQRQQGALTTTGPIRTRKESGSELPPAFAVFSFLRKNNR